MCPSCLVRETQAQVQSSLKSESRVTQMNAQILINKSLTIDQSIQVSQDIFNAKMISINELKLTIDNDSTIENDKKHFLLARTLDDRFKHLVQVIAGLNEQQREIQNEQRAIQTYYNELAKKLREDEREQIKLRDVQYQPPIKPIVKQKAPSIKKYDKNVIKQVARETGMPENTIQMIVVARQIEPLTILRIFNEMKAGNMDATMQFANLISGKKS
jgi:predicted transcriptional regulator